MYTIFSCLFLFSTLSRASTIKDKLLSIHLGEEDIVTSYYQLENIYKLKKNRSEHDFLCKFFEQKFLPQIKSYLEKNSEIFLTEAVNSSIVFQIFLSFYDRGSENINFLFFDIREKCIELKNPPEKVTEEEKQKISKDVNAKLSDITIKARRFVESKIYILLQKSFNEWDQSKKIIKLYIRFLKKIKSFVFPFEGSDFSSTTLRINIERYKFIVKKFSEFLESKNQTDELVKLYIKLKTLPIPKGLEEDQVRDQLNNVGKKFYLFSLSASFILSSEDFELKNFPLLNTKLLCQFIIFEDTLWTLSNYLVYDDLYKKGIITYLQQNFKSTEIELINSAFDILCDDLGIAIRESDEASILKNVYITSGCNTLSKAFLNSLRKYVEDAYDCSFDETSKISKWKLQAFLHLFPLQSKSKINA
jgi:hypothetical protein